jgi:hypothetical protein
MVGPNETVVANHEIRWEPFGQPDVRHRPLQAQGDGNSRDSARSRLKAALIRARWVNACAKLPSASPAGPISSANRPTWLA